MSVNKLIFLTQACPSMAKNNIAEPFREKLGDKLSEPVTGG